MLFYFPNKLVDHSIYFYWVPVITSVLISPLFVSPSLYVEDGLRQNNRNKTSLTPTQLYGRSFSKFGGARYILVTLPFSGSRVSPLWAQRPNNNFVYSAFLFRLPRAVHFTCITHREREADLYDQLRSGISLHRYMSGQLGTKATPLSSSSLANDGTGQWVLVDIGFFSWGYHEDNRSVIRTKHHSSRFGSKISFAKEVIHC